jgi:hypothetical protein
MRRGNRHEDSNGIDAGITAWGPFPGGGYLQEVDLKVQLKATVLVPADDGENLSYFLKELRRYDDLGVETANIARVLVVLFMPSEAQEWLELTAETSSSCVVALTG